MPHHRTPFLSSKVALPRGWTIGGGTATRTSLGGTVLARKDNDNDNDNDNGPSVELVKHFVTYAFCTRDLVSAIIIKTVKETHHSRSLSLTLS